MREQDLNLDLQINKKRCYPIAIVIWDELYVAVRHISPPNRVSKTDREVGTALERKGSRGCSAVRRA